MSGIFIPTVSGVYNRENSTCTGDDVTLLFATTSTLQQRYGIQLTNTDASFNLFGRAVNLSEAAPTASTTDYDFIVAPGAMLTLLYGAGISIYVWNESGAATTSTYTAAEVLA